MRCCIDWHLQRRVDCLLATADPSQALVSDMGPEYLTRDSDGDAVVVGTLDLAAILPASSDIEAASSGALAAANAAEAADAGLMLWLIGFRVLGSSFTPSCRPRYAREIRLTCGCWLRRDHILCCIHGKPVRPSGCSAAVCGDAAGGVRSGSRGSVGCGPKQPSSSPPCLTALSPRCLSANVYCYKEAVVVVIIASSELPLAKGRPGDSGG